LRESSGNPARNLCVYGIGNEDAVFWRMALETGRDVDPIAEDIIAIDDDVAEIDADTELDRRFARSRMIINAIAS
jgi:hypothetical protein